MYLTPEMDLRSCVPIRQRIFFGGFARPIAVHTDRAQGTTFELYEQQRSLLFPIERLGHKQYALPIHLHLIPLRLSHPLHASLIPGNPTRAARLFSSNNRSLHQKAIDSLKSGSGRIRVWLCVGDPGKPAANKWLVNSSACCAIRD